MHDQFIKFQQHLAILREFDIQLEVSGAEIHRYELQQPWTDVVLSRFEQRHELVLPQDYREFLQKVGSAGAGPYRGLSEPTPLTVVWSREGRISSFSRPFALEHEWAPEDGPLPISDGASPHDGCLHLADHGRGYFDFLVVRGAHAGQVWSDYTAGDGPICKANDNFVQWYGGWLNSALVDHLVLHSVDFGLRRPRNFDRLDDAIDALGRALRRAPQWAAGWRAQGYVHLNRGAWELALAAFERACACGTQESAARRHLDFARVALMRGDPETAIAHIDEGLSDPALSAETRAELAGARSEALELANAPSGH